MSWTIVRFHPRFTRRVAQRHLQENKRRRRRCFYSRRPRNFLNRFYPYLQKCGSDRKKARPGRADPFSDAYGSLRLVPIFVGRACTQECLSRERRLPYIYCLRHPPRLLRVTTLYLILDRLRIRIIGIVKLAVNNIK